LKIILPQQPLECVLQIVDGGAPGSFGEGKSDVVHVSLLVRICRSLTGH